jgi:hypothetical protein
MLQLVPLRYGDTHCHVTGYAADFQYPPAEAQAFGGRDETLHHVISRSKHQLMTAGIVHVTNRVTPGPGVSATLLGGGARITFLHESGMDYAALTIPPEDHYTNRYHRWGPVQVECSFCPIA